MFVFFLFASAAFASASPLQKLPFSSIPMDQLVVPAGVKGCSTTFFDSGQMWLACDGKNVAYFTGVNHVEKSMLLAKMFDAELPLISCSASSEIEFDEDEDDYVSSTEESCFFQKKVP